MPTKFPIEYDIEPKKLDKGNHWVTLLLKNIGEKTIKRLNIDLHSTDTHNLKILTSSEFLADLKPGEQEVTPFQVMANRSTSIYATISGLEDHSYFYWESPTINLSIGEDLAELTELYVLAHPYSTLEKTLEVEATIKGLKETENLELVFWVNKPSGVFKKIGAIKPKRLKAGETARYSVEFKPDEKGIHEVYAYLNHEGKMIGRETDKVVIEEA
jgi:hypothetical protein